MVFEVFIHIQGVQEFRVETGEQHVDHNHKINLLRVLQVLIGVLLIFDALLHV
jgi:hypothetical protein